MRGDDQSPSRSNFPNNWDVLHDPSANDEPPVENEPVSGANRNPPLLNLLASSWADSVSVLGVCTAALVGLSSVGLNGSLSALPWAVGLGVAWWAAAAAVLIVIRQGTPGMLLAGIVFRDRVSPRRLPVVIGAAAVSAVLAGLPGLLGATRSPLALAAGSALESVPTV
jgi:hypothetical protein